MDGDADVEGSVEEGGRGEGDDTNDPDFIELPVGYTPHLPSSSEPPSLQNRPRRLVWVIFGATGHLGRSICRNALEMGDNVTAVGRDVDGEQVMQNWHARCQGLVCDVKVRRTLEEVIEKARAKWGRIDVIANCAGFGIIGSCEDQDETDIRSQFDTNVLGILNILQLTLPYFRERGYGRYIIFSSIAGFSGIPGLGPYGATKFAVEGLVESLMYEIEPFGVKATLVEPSITRRDEPDELAANIQPPLWGHFLIKPPSAPYRPSTSPAQHALKMVDWLKHNQPTSAVKIAECVWELAHCEHPPLRLLMGSHAVETTRDRLRAIIEEIEEWKHLNFPSDHLPSENEEGEHSRTEGENDDGDGDNDDEGDEGEDGDGDMSGTEGEDHDGEDEDEVGGN
ncbi:hypothetical protein BGX38DRAFT_1086497 [Terfezia claveryi]|nr:hypothetical protein BGX38DRAFT_1086497 [Terfezia claveryi]